MSPTWLSILLRADTQVVTDLPEQVEVVLAESAASVVVTLRNQKFLHPMPTQRASLELRLGRMFTRAQGLVDGQELTISRENGATKLELPPVGTFEVILLTVGEAA